MHHFAGAAILDAIRIMIADDHTLFREGMSRILAMEPGLQVVGEACDGDDAVSKAIVLEPDILLLDIQMPRRTGLEALTALRAACPNLKTIILTANSDRSQTIEALRLGARGVVRKDVEVPLLVKCLHNVMAGGYWVEHELVNDLVGALRQVQDHTRDRSPVMTLTRRELQIIASILDGASNEDISRQYGMRTQTVKNHLTNIFDKLGVSSRLELALFAISHQLLEQYADLLS
jgi:DNA-binding NarL/FixJ family response regulator